MSAKEIFEGDDEQSSEEDDCSIIDEDTCTPSEIESKFLKRFAISEEAVSLKKTYVLNLSCDDTFSRVAAGISNNTTQVFNITETAVSRNSEHLMNLERKNARICGVEFAKDDPNLLLTGTTDGTIVLYDLRTNERIHTLEDILTGIKKPITCFDINANNRIVCAGTEKITREVFLLFFDLRQKQSLGSYWESHSDEVTSVVFHPSNPDLLASGSTDGLINIFDISNATEDDAMKVVVNTDSSVQKLQWHKNVYEKDIVSCITHLNELKLYEAEEGDRIAEFTRNWVACSLKRKSECDCYLVNCHNLNDDRIFLLAGSNYNKGEALRSLTIKNKKLKAFCSYEDNKQIVRDSVYNSKNDVLVTGGEGGIVSLWTAQEPKEVTTSANLKIKSKSTKEHKRKPY